jgi:hypothetical protein
MVMARAAAIKTSTLSLNIRKIYQKRIAIVKKLKVLIGTATGLNDPFLLKHTHLHTTLGSRTVTSKFAIQLSKIAFSIHADGG